MKNRKYSAKAVAFDLGKILVGSFIAAVGFQYFMYPNSIPSGSLTGVGQIINLLIHVPVGVITILLNIPLFAIVWKKLGRRFVVYSLICMLAVSVFIDLLAMGAHTGPPAIPWLAAVYGGVLYGGGLRAGVHHREPRRRDRHPRQAPADEVRLHQLRDDLHGHPGVHHPGLRLVFRKIESCMYAIICSFITNKIVDLMLYGPATSRQCYIISERSDELRRAIVNQLARRHPPGGEGGLVGQDKQVILCVIRPRQITALRRWCAPRTRRRFSL